MRLDLDREYFVISDTMRSEEFLCQNCTKEFCKCKPLRSAQNINIKYPINYIHLSVINQREKKPNTNF